MLMKNPLTPAGIEPATFRFVAQHLNHYATVVPKLTPYKLKFILKYTIIVNKIYTTDIKKIIFIVSYLLVQF